MTTSNEFVTLLKCPHCEQSGSVFWELNGGHARHDGSKRKLIRLSTGFHEEMGRIAADESTIVCDVCDEILWE